MKKKFTLPNMEFTFQIQSKGEETDINWVGEFKYKRPTLGARSRIASLRSRLNGDVETLEQEIEDFNHAAAYLRYTLTDFPQWWEDASFGMDMYDGNIISDIYNKCMTWEAEWQKKIHNPDPEKVADVQDQKPEQDADGEVTG